MNFIKKNWQKDAPKTLIQAGCRVVGGVGGAFVANKVFSSQNTDTNTTLKNISGPVVLGIGILGSMMLDKPELKAVCEGMATYGGLRSLAVLSPNFSTATGISGLEQEEAAMFGLGAGEEEVVYVDEEGNQVNPDGTPINGVEDDTDEEADAAMFGLGSNEQSTDAALPEFNEGTPANDGNPWAEVADQIDVDGGVETTQGIGDADAAAMF